ncbi:glycosyltransferase family 4 protein [Hyalangium gracile]|uniref:glycosyltransferase family 4 protein n=1 Tax=Hyalangium gracile TaxID=394092 RepID=UPI001CD028EC|nr:glycosyltransferase family 4 protein [Hyalangium gracile]
MHILLLSNLYPPDILGGYELLARDVAEVLTHRGHTVEVLTTGSRTSEASVIRTLRLARPFGRPAGRDRLRHFWAGLRNRAATRAYLRTHAKPQVALVMSLRRLGLAPLRVLQQAGIPFVLTVNDDWPVAYAAGLSPRGHTRFGQWLDEVLVPARTWSGLVVNRVLYLSEAVRREVRNAGAPLASGVVQSQGVDLSLFTPRAFRPMRAKLRLLCVGRLHPSKAPEVALETLAALKQRGVPATLTFVGEAGEPGFQIHLQRRTQELGLEPLVTWAGKHPREQLPALYHEADALLFLSRLEHEGQGLTYLEAMACGLPVVAWPSGGAREFLERHDAARLVPACSGEAFADALTALRGDPAAQEAIVQRALEVVRAHASLDAYVRCLEGQLRHAARGSTGP